MKRSRNLAGLHAIISGILLVALFVLAGCETEKPFSDATGLPGLPPTATNTDVAGKSNPFPVTGTNELITDRFQVGDIVSVQVFSHGGDKKFEPFGTRIGEDGMISPPEIAPVKAVGKTMAQLQKDILAEYQTIYRGVTVSVTAGERYFHVLGEVNSPGQKPYLSKMDVVGAITSAGGPTIFAGNGILLMRSNGKIVEADYKKALRGDPKNNLPVYPGDKIFVKKRII